MEKYRALACLYVSMWIIPIVCAIEPTTGDGSRDRIHVRVKSSSPGDETLPYGLAQDQSHRDVRSSGPSIGDVDGDISKFEPIFSNPIIEELSDSALMFPDRRRDAPDRGFLDETKLEILELHNLYRGNVTPPAGNMAFMEWDTKLEHLAQLWADGCVFAHGKPPNTSYPGAYGQNLYIGTDPTGYKGIWLWYDEYNYYDLKKQFCDPNQQCGHFITMAWAESHKIGCGIRKCGLRYLMVCHYFPAALKGQQMYIIAKPCSQCQNESGSLCRSNLCMTWEQCDRNPKHCETANCDLKCQNCGRLNTTSCRCECADGWDSPDCSRLCSDEHERCGVSPGFPNIATCSMNRHTVAKKYCRKMCNTCNSYETDTKINHICCDGRFCKDGYVLDLDRKPCRCALLCPGPQCDILEGSGVSLKNSFMVVILTAAILYFVKHY